MAPPFLMHCIYNLLECSELLLSLDIDTQVAAQMLIGLLTVKVPMSGIHMAPFLFFLGFEVIFYSICHDTPHICLRLLFYFGLKKI